VGEDGSNKGFEGLSCPFFGIFKRLGGTISGFGTGGQELFLADKRQKKGFFSFNRGFLGLFCVQSKRPLHV
jgi:hypothetical protein